MKKIYLIRHAQSESNAELIVRPNPDIALTQLGRQQADEVADWLIAHVPTPTAVFVSPYVRTHQTAAPYLTRLESLGITPIVLDDLHEFDYLDFEHIKDLSFAEILVKAEAFWAHAKQDYADSPRTESFDNLAMRVRQIRRYFDALDDGTYVVFTHGMWLGMLMWQLIHHDSTRTQNMVSFRQFELAVRPKNCEVYLLQGDPKAGMAFGICKVRARGEK